MGPCVSFGQMLPAPSIPPYPWRAPLSAANSPTSLMGPCPVMYDARVPNPPPPYSSYYPLHHPPPAPMIPFACGSPPLLGYGPSPLLPDRPFYDRSFSSQSGSPERPSPPYPSSQPHAPPLLPPFPMHRQSKRPPPRNQFPSQREADVDPYLAERGGGGHCPRPPARAAPANTESAHPIAAGATGRRVTSAATMNATPSIGEYTALSTRQLSSSEGTRAGPPPARSKSEEQERGKAKSRPKSTASASSGPAERRMPVPPTPLAAAMDRVPADVLYEAQPSGYEE